MSIPRPKKTRRAPFSLRLTESERADLLMRAGSLPLGFYVKQILFADAVRPARKPKTVLADHALLARVLAGLGGSRLASNLNQLAKAANMGSLPVTQETEADLRQACAEIAEMRTLLLAGLGIERHDKAFEGPMLLNDVREAEDAHP